MDRFVIFLCKIIGKLSALLGGGSSLPGRIALKLRPSILKVASKGYKIIMVTGTNGKTTTSAMIAGILKNNGKEVIANSSGANMTDGIASTFIMNYGKKGYAVIECDEAYTRLVNRLINTNYMVVTNVFKDQMDRFSEIYVTWAKIKEAIGVSKNINLVLNGDEPLFAEDFPNKTYYYGFAKGDKKGEASICPKCSKALSYDFFSFNNLGSYKCTSCDFARPQLSYKLEKIESLGTDSSIVYIDGERMELPFAGLYNVYNALAAFSVTKCLGLTNAEIANGLKKQKTSFGRNEIIKVGESELQLSLIKNPTGADQCINTIALYDKPCSILVMLNDNWGDGKDVSWVWDAHFENLSRLKIENIIVGGLRRYDMAVRLKTAGFDTNKFIIADTDEDIIEIVKNKKERVFALCTYSAMTGIRKTFYKKGIVKDMWK